MVVCECVCEGLRGSICERVWVCVDAVVDVCVYVWIYVDVRM